MLYELGLGAHTDLQVGVEGGDEGGVRRVPGILAADPPLGKEGVGKVGIEPGLLQAGPEVVAEAELSPRIPGE